MLNAKLLDAKFKQEDYEPSDDGSHRTLGITLEGMIRMSEAIGFMYFTGHRSSGPALQKHYKNHDGWAITKEYDRDEDMVAKFGPLKRKEGEFGLEDEWVLFYDLCAYV